MNKSVAEWKLLLRTKLTEAMKARRQGELSLFRQVLGALDDAEAAELSLAPAAEDGVIAKSVSGLGRGEVNRKALSPEEAVAVLRSEISERRLAATNYRALGQPTEATRLDEEAALLEALLQD